MAQIILRTFSSLILLSVISINFSCVDNQGTKTNISSDSSITTENHIQPRVADSAIVDTGIKASSKWFYYDEDNEMNSSKTKFATIDANDELYFSAPYDGGVTAKFIVRRKEGKTDVMLSISKGQFIIDVGERNITRIRFDDEKPIHVAYVGPSDYSSTTIFFESVSTILNKLKKAKKMFIEAEFYSEGTKVMQFDVAGFQWGKKN